MADVTNLQKINNTSLFAPEETDSILASDWEGPFDPSITHKVALSNITPEVPHASDPSLAGRASSGSGFPNLAWESLKVGLAKEKQISDQINLHIKEAEKQQKDMDLLLDFSAELTANKDGEGEMSEKLKAILSELKSRGIDLHKSEDTSLSKEKIAELKSLASAQVDKLRSNLQILFTTKIQPLTNFIGLIMDTLKDILRNNTRLINKANELSRH